MFYLIFPAFYALMYPREAHIQPRATLEGRVEEATFMKTAFPIGAIVRNFDLTAKVIGYHEEASCLIVRGYGLRDARTGKWLADPAKCERLDKPAEILFPAGALIGFEA